MPQLSDIKNLFPTRMHAVIFVGYMALFINQGILITATKGKDNTYPYNPTTLVLLTGVCKLIVASCLFIKESGLFPLLAGMSQHWKVLLLYFCPAFLYSLYNNLAFTNLKTFDPTTYFLLLQFRVVVTGVIFQIIFKKKLSRMQWVSLLLLTVGCIIKQLNLSSIQGAGTTVTSGFGLKVDLSLILLLVQILCSCFAGVYNEFLLKDKGQEVPFFLQNVFMYLNEIVANMFFLQFNGQVVQAFSLDAVHSVFQLKPILIILNNAGIGIVTALFLRSLNSILKTFASALELMFTAVLSWFIFGIPINLMTVVAIAIVSYATLLYAQNPVDNTPKPKTSSMSEPLKPV